MKIILANPRGFCAGVNMAIEALNEAIRMFGSDIYVYHEIVHNKYVVERFTQQGVTFVNEIDEIPPGSILLYSAHGVSPEIREQSRLRKLQTIDATCPLVTKVHLEAVRYARDGYHIVLIGHEGHDEVIGTMGEAPASITLVETPEDVARLAFADDAKIAYLTQTTLSVDEAARVIAALKVRYPKIDSPPKEDICYATTNRQAAVKAIAKDCDLLIVIGSPNSSNSQRLREVAERAGAGRAILVPKVADMDFSVMEGVQTVGITAGASAPETLVQEVLSELSTRFALQIEERQVTTEDVIFKLPYPLA